MLKEDTETNCNYNGKNWAFQIKDMLQKLGLGFVWEQQFYIEIPFTLIKQRLIDNYLQKWYAEINNSSRLQSYCISKHNFEIESYLNTLAEKKYRVALTRFRISAHNLEIENGRYENLPGEQRLCKSCNMNKIENEYHFLLVCPHFRELRSKYLKPYFCRWPTLCKFAQLLSSTSKTTTFRLAKFICLANKIRIS